MQLSFDCQFEDLHSLSGLKKLDSLFLSFLGEVNSPLREQLLQARDNHRYSHADCNSSPRSEPPRSESQLIIDLSYILDDFIAHLFQIKKENLDLKQQHAEFDLMHECQRKFIQRYAIKTYTADKLQALDFKSVCQKLQSLLQEPITAQKIAETYFTLSQDEQKNQQALDLLAQYCAFMVHMNSKIPMFNIARKVNHNLHIREYKIKQIKETISLGFDYRDHEQSIATAHMQSKYCIYCHNQRKDSCAHGLIKEQQVVQPGCPLQQKISEMNLVKSHGFNIAALAIIIIDNPLLVVTGHRICNDCMKACIYQKQEPVNIPIIETDILNKVLSLPWGVEIYLLLTKWNPLNFAQPLPLPISSHQVLVVGLGPAGFALCHYLLNAGHNVTAIDGLKITPLYFDTLKPIKSWQQIKLPLSQRQPHGFGGVAEYGITNRWDKNNLTLVRLLLQRRQHFTMHGGIRLGSNITINQALTMFDHVALCIGGGQPKFQDLPGYFSKGVHIAADFLMHLQQGGAFLSASNANLLIRMPAVVIGCGLTAIDSAVELMHYYPKHVEQFLLNYEANYAKVDLTQEEQIIADELIKHALMFRQARNAADKLKIMQEIGGVTICYRDSITKSKAYSLNSEEIEHAIAIGVQFREHSIPKTIIADDFGWVRQVVFEQGIADAKTVLVALGTEANMFYDILTPQSTYTSGIFKTKEHNISHFGDCNLDWSGSVVKALASVKNGYRQISEVLALQKRPKMSGLTMNINRLEPAQSTCLASMISLAIVEKVTALAQNITEITIYSPFAVQNFKPGQFFKLQNYSDHAKCVAEPLAIGGAYINKNDNTISLIILATGVSSRICSNLKAGSKIMLMGPAGAPTQIVHNKRVALIGGGIGNATLIAVAQGLKEQNCHITYFGSYHALDERCYPEKIEEYAEQIIWTCPQATFLNRRKQDISIKGSIIDGLYYAHDLGITKNIEHIICKGSIEMMKAVTKHQQKLFGDVVMICSTSALMQCMMKGICGKCIQKTNDNKGYTFTCAAQDQPSSMIDFEALENRLKQHSLLEKISISSE